MSWPLASHFSAMLQNPRIAFRDPQLQGCSVEKDAKRQPRPWAGAFAVVYKGIDANGKDPFAVRVFTTESPERRERYDRISAYLKGRKVTCLVDFEYRDRSIRSAGDGKWYPLILMEWVQGETLFHWVRARCLEQNSRALGLAAQRWADLVQELFQASIAHGDLQHANVMVTTGGELKLVDYDCMCVPALVGRRNLEVGVQPYQHPGRNEKTLLAPDLDNFSALVVYVGLRALAAQPALWAKHVEQTGYDKLLFRPEDFQSPADSTLYQDLLRSPAGDVRDLVQQLFGWYRGRMDEVPPLSHLAHSYAKVEKLLMRQQWAAAVEVLNRRGQFRDAPQRLKPLIRQAYEHVCRQEAWQAFQEIPQETSEPNDRKLVNAWNEVLFAGYQPAERQRIRVAEARRRVALVDVICHLAGQCSGGERSAGKTPGSSGIALGGEQSLVEAAYALPQGYQYSLGPRVELARRRVGAVARLEKVLAEPTAEAAIVAAWRAVVEAKCETLVDAARRPRIELAKRRAAAIKSLAAIADDLPADQRDRRLMETWQEDLLADCREAQRWRPAHQAAAARKQLLQRLSAALKSRDRDAIARLAQEPCLANYPLPAELHGVVKTARERAGRTGALLEALRDEQRSSFRELFDARLIRDCAERFAPYESLLGRWIRSEVLSPEMLGLGSAAARGSVEELNKPAGSHRVRWSWPHERFSEQCVLAISVEEPGPQAVPGETALLHRVPVDRESWESGGGSWVLHSERDWKGAYVVVWAVVDVGFRTFFSLPLVLGRLGDRVGWKWKGLRSIFTGRGEHLRSAEERQT